MKLTDSELDDQASLNRDQLFPSSELLQFILRHGQEGLEALPDVEPRIAGAERLIQAGLLQQDHDAILRLAPKLVRDLEQLALMEIFRDLRNGAQQDHTTRDSGRSSQSPERTERYEFGDPASEPAPRETARNVMKRDAANRPTRGNHSPSNLDIDDSVIHNSYEPEGGSAMVVLLDLSGSMIRHGRFIQAKRIAMGLNALVRRRFPTDTIHFVGFSSRAERISASALPLVMPQPISTRESQVRLRIPLDQADDAPQHFTNLHHGLRTARSILSRDPASDKQILIITDGQPTAHLETSRAGVEMLYLLYPPTKKTWRTTLREALRCSRAGIRLSSFTLIEDFYYMDWVSFIEQMTKLTRGTAFYCTAGDLASVVMESYLSGKQQGAGAPV